jgi:hypothetical protein
LVDEIILGVTMACIYPLLPKVASGLSDLQQLSATIFVGQGMSIVP